MFTAGSVGLCSSHDSSVVDECAEIIVNSPTCLSVDSSVENNVNTFPMAQNDGVITKLVLNPNSVMSIEDSESSDTRNFDTICLEINSSNGVTDSKPGIFKARTPIRFKNSKIILSEDAQFHCLAELILENCSIVINLIKGYKPKFKVENGLRIEGGCTIEIGENEQFDLETYMKDKNAVSAIFEINKPLKN